MHVNSRLRVPCSYGETLGCGLKSHPPALLLIDRLKTNLYQEQEFERKRDVFMIYRLQQRHGCPCGTMCVNRPIMVRSDPNEVKSQT